MTHNPGLTPQLVQSTQPRTIGKSKCLGYLAQYLTKGIYLVHDLGLKKKKKKKRPMYPVQYLHSKTTTRVPDPGPIVRLVRTMAQDSMQKKKNRSTCH